MLSLASPGVHLSPDEARAWRAAVAHRLDAVRLAELAVLRHKLAIAEAVEVEIATLRAIAAVHGFDPAKAWTLTDDDAVVPAPPPAPPRG